MNIKLISINLHNFKGIRDLKVEFSDNTYIFGENGTGKTTLFDAFTWLLFGKDSHDAKEFNIKTLDDNGRVIERIDHSVIGVLDIDGRREQLTRTYSEKWTRRRGSETEELTGHETSFYHNGVPLQAGQYKQLIDSIVDEQLFKLITSATYFNTMKWQDRRGVLIKIAGGVNTDDVLTTLPKPQHYEVKNILNSGKKLDDYRKEQGVLKRKLSDDLKLLPARIDEVKRGTPERQDFAGFKATLLTKQNVLVEIEDAITNQVNAHRQETERIQAKQNKIYALKSRLKALEFEAAQESQKELFAAQAKRNEIQSRISSLESMIRAHKAELAIIGDKIRERERKIEELRLSWHTHSALELHFNEGDFNCPTCRRLLDPTTIVTRKEIMQAEFEKSKADKLNGIKAEGGTANKSLEKLKIQQAELVSNIAALERDVVDFRATLDALPSSVTPSDPVLPVEHATIQDQIAAMELAVMEAPKLDLDGLKQQKATIQTEIDNIKRILATEAQITQATERLNTLLEQERSLAQQLADIERVEFACDAYTKAYMAAVENAVNGKFNLVKWRMFNTTLTGTIEETCECMVNGVPYSDVNSAGKIQAGIDCINTLSQYYNVYCPIWVDNRESVNTLPVITSQVINLVVSKDKELSIQ